MRYSHESNFAATAEAVVQILMRMESYENNTLSLIEKIFCCGHFEMNLVLYENI